MKISLTLARKAYSVILLCTLFVSYSLAQETAVKPVKGQIKDAQGKPLEGATVQVKNGNAVTVTKADGSFTLNAAENALLVVTAVGYQPQEIAVRFNTQLDILLKTSTNALDDVIVIGYGMRKKSDVTGSVASVKAEQIAQVPTTNITQALQGRVPGMVVNTTNNRPGETPSIRVRGNRTLSPPNGNNPVGSSRDEPIYVIDGIVTPFSISDFNPLDIESIEVLKDASATAIYGARGANGVILITTKRGKAGRMSVEVNSTLSFDSPLRKLDLMNGGQFAEFRRNAYRGTNTYNRNASTSLPSIGYADPLSDQKIFGDYYLLRSIYNGYQWRDRTNLVPFYRTTTAAEKSLYGIDSIPVYDPSKVSTYDWADQALRGGVTQNYQVRVSGGTDKLRGSFSGGYFKQQGIQYGQDYTRYSGAVTGDFKPTSYLSFGASLNTSWAIQNFGPDVYSSAAGQFPLAVPYDTAGQFITLPGGDIAIANPLNDKNTIFDERRINRMFGSLYGEVQVLKGLRLRVNFGPDFSTSRRGQFAGSVSSARQGGTPTASYGQNNNYNWTLENLLFYDTKIGTAHSLNVTLLQGLQKTRSESSQISAIDLPYESQLWYALQTTNSPTSATYSTSFSQTQLESYMGRVNYSLLNKYLLTVSGRWDGASQLAPQNKWTFFPSAALAWKVDQETFLKKLSFVDQLKLRLGYGSVGQLNIGPYVVAGTLSQTAYVWDETPAYGYSPGLPTPNLSWPKTNTINAGLDFGIFKNRVSGSIDVYRADTKNNILPRALPGASGFTGISYNVGLIRNTGLEISLYTVNVNNKRPGGFRWTSEIVFARNKEQVLDVDGTKTSNVGNRWFIGYPTQVYYNYKFQGIYQRTKSDSAILGGLKTSGLGPGVVKVQNTNGDSLINQNDYQILGSPIPKWTGSFNNTFSYKGFDLSVFAYVSWGAMLNSTRTRPNLSGRYPIQNLNYWTPTNPSNEYPKAATGVDIPLFGEALQYQDASFVRIRSISLQYNLPKTWIKKFASNLSFSINAVNPFLFSKFKILDPEVTNAGISSQTGTAVFLSTKSIVLGLKMSL